MSATDRNVIDIPGLNGGTALGFLATLGGLDVLDREALHTNRERPELSWHEGTGTPVLHGNSELERLIFDDALAWEQSPLLEFGYPKLEKNGVKLFRGLKGPAAAWRAWLLACVGAGDEMLLDFAASLAAETATEEAVESKTVKAEHFEALGVPFDLASSMTATTMPTFFDFTSRNAQFLDQVRLVRAAVTPELIASALRGDPADTEGRTLGWDSAADRPAALYEFGRQPNPVLEWLAFRALRFFPSFGRGGRLVTTGCTGRRKSGKFTWPLWSAPATVPTVCALLRQRVEDLSLTSRRVRGVFQVFEVGLTKGVDGYSGIFTPSRTV